MRGRELRGGLEGEEEGGLREEVEGMSVHCELGKLLLKCLTKPR